MNFLLYDLALPIAVIAILVGGILWLTSGGSEKRISEGRTILFSAVIGFLIAFSAWVLVNTLLDTLGFEIPVSSGVKNWFSYDICSEFGTVAGIPDDKKKPEQPPTPKTMDSCSEPTKLASEHNVPASATNAKELQDLLTCIKNHPKVKGKNLGEESTFDKSHPICNLTRGDKHCDPDCSHAPNSCHYGGKSGTQGSLAVDFGNEDLDDDKNGANDIIEAALSCPLARRGGTRCETNRGVGVDCRDPSATHVHISVVSCDALP